MDHFQIDERIAIAPFLFVFVPVLANFQSLKQQVIRHSIASSGRDSDDRSSPHSDLYQVRTSRVWQPLGRFLFGWGLMVFGVGFHISVFS